MKDCGLYLGLCLSRGSLILGSQHSCLENTQVSLWRRLHGGELRLPVNSQPVNLLENSPCQAFQMMQPWEATWLLAQEQPWTKVPSWAAFWCLMLRICEITYAGCCKLLSSGVICHIATDSECFPFLSPATPGWKPILSLPVSHAARRKASGLSFASLTHLTETSMTWRRGCCRELILRKMVEGDSIFRGGRGEIARGEPQAQPLSAWAAVQEWHGLTGAICHGNMHIVPGFQTWSTAGHSLIHFV